MVANRTRETRPSGMTWGACGNASHGSRTEAHREIYGIATEPLKIKRAVFLSRLPYSRLEVPPENQLGKTDDEFVKSAQKMLT